MGLYPSEYGRPTTATPVGEFGRDDVVRRVGASDAGGRRALFAVIELIENARIIGQIRNACLSRILGISVAIARKSIPSCSGSHSSWFCFYRVRKPRIA
jgi:hypothetical protein